MERVVQDLAWSSYVRTLKLKQRSEATVRDYAYSYRTLSTWLGKPAVKAVRPEVESWLEHRLKLVSPTRVAQDQLNLKIIYTWAVSEEIISRHPTDRIPRIVVTSKPPQVIDPAEMKALKDSCRGKKFMDVRDAALIGVLTLVGTPLMGELTSMRLDAVDLRNDLIGLTGKTGSRVIPLSVAAALLMERYLRSASQASCQRLRVALGGQEGTADASRGADDS